MKKQLSKIILMVILMSVTVLTACQSTPVVDPEPDIPVKCLCRQYSSTNFGIFSSSSTCYSRG